VVHGIFSPAGLRIAGILLALSAASAWGKSATPVATLQLDDCRLETASTPAVVKAKCGFLEVPENRDAANSKSIRLRVAVVPALSLRKAPDPLVFITGGPGEAATEDYVRSAAIFERVHRDRDIVLVDQRGTGSSNPLQCELDDDETLVTLNLEQIKQHTAQCLAALHGDPRFYTTSVAVTDLEAVRIALGYERWNLWGGSYGTRVAQHYLRRYPQRVRSVVLDGIVPPTLALGPGIAVEAQRALESMFSRCAVDAACRAVYPDLKNEYLNLRTQLARSPMTTEFPDPATAEKIKLPFGLGHLASAIRLLSYSDVTVALLPYLIHQAAAAQNMQPLAAQFKMNSAALRSVLSVGMAYSVQCTEDAPFFTANAAEDPALVGTYLGRQFLDGFVAICGVWPRGVIDSDLHAPLHSEVPALLLSGENDPVTPPTYGAQALEGFVHGKHVVLRGQGHIQSGTGCMRRLLATFVATANAEQLEVSCTEKVKAAPFLLSASAISP
jgi:pimeloyl-ACP methyl ester carboxylesterase